MSLLGVVSSSPLLTQTIPSNDGWAFVVQEESKRWAVSARGAGGVLAVHQGATEWTVCTDSFPPSAPITNAWTGDLVVAAATPQKQGAQVARSSGWFFIYEGGIEDVDALCAALEPKWFVRGGYPEDSGKLIFAHVMTNLAEVDSTLADQAMARVAIDLHRARSLGPAAFLCSNGTKLYAYAAGHPLLFSNSADAILIGSSEVLPRGPTTRELSDGSLVALARSPQLGWSILAEPSPGRSNESFAAQQARRGFR